MGLHNAAYTHTLYLSAGLLSSSMVVLIATVRKEQSSVFARWRQCTCHLLMIPRSPQVHMLSGILIHSSVSVVLATHIPYTLQWARRCPPKLPFPTDEVHFPNAVLIGARCCISSSGTFSSFRRHLQTHVFQAAFNAP